MPRAEEAAECHLCGQVCAAEDAGGITEAYVPQVTAGRSACDDADAVTAGLFPAIVGGVASEEAA